MGESQPAAAPGSQPRTGQLRNAALANLVELDPAPSWAQPNSSQSDALHIRAVIETPRGSRIKYKFDEDLRAFSLKSRLPAGMVFPHNFGFVPRTRGGDGDPLDVLLLSEDPLFPGCVTQVRLLGYMQVEQSVEGQPGRTERNDRLLAVLDANDLFSPCQHVNELPQTLRTQLEEFFATYHRLQGKPSRTLGWHGPEAARDLLDEALRRWQITRWGKE